MLKNTDFLAYFKILVRLTTDSALPSNKLILHNYSVYLFPAVSGWWIILLKNYAQIKIDPKKMDFLKNEQKFSFYYFNNF